MNDGLRMPRVKVCGLTRGDDVEAAVGAGADAIGLVRYAPSPRDLAADRAAELVARLPRGVLSVAVMVDADPDDATAWTAIAGVRALQLCGGERPGDWGGFPLPILRRIAVGPGAEAEVEAWKDVAAGFVLDHPGAPGGSGRPVDRDLSARLARRAPVLLAGGLDETNVAEAIHAVRPAGVDVSSRLESEPGRKDPGRVRAFVERALAALEEVSP